MVNMVVLVVLALKNTPLAFLSAWSYERLNVLHQVAGYMTIVCTVVHGSCYSAYFVQGGRTAVLLQMKEVYGMIAASSFLIIGFAGAVLRRRWYELFYYVHVVFWVLSVVMIGLHQPNVSLRIVTATLLAGCIWSADRIIRSTRLMLYCVNNAVTLTPLANGATRVTMAKAPIGAESGKHAFLWIPKIRAFETHPFTIAALGPMEFVINSHDGFTRDLHMYAVSNPGARLWASVEGSYGQIPDPATFDTVVLVAGGSGASFTFGMALNLLHKMRSDENKRVIFVWIVKSYGESFFFFFFVLSVCRARDEAADAGARRIPRLVRRPPPHARQRLAHRRAALRDAQVGVGDDDAAAVEPRGRGGDAAHGARADDDDARRKGAGGPPAAELEHLGALGQVGGVAGRGAVAHAQHPRPVPAARRQRHYPRRRRGYALAPPRPGARLRARRPDEQGARHDGGVHALRRASRGAALRAVWLVRGAGPLSSLLPPYFSSSFLPMSSPCR